MAPAPGSFHILVAKNLRILRLAVQKTSQFLGTKAPITSRSVAQAEPIFARVAPSQPIHPAAFLRQSKRWLSSHTSFASAVRRFTTSQTRNAGPKYDRSAFPASRVATAISRSTGRAPFASALRPNLTGGALGRTAGGYSTGAGRIGGARYFSHGPAAQAQVISNVSQAVRAFCLNGQRAMYDGVDARSGKPRYKALSALREEALTKMDGVPKASPGSYIDFAVNPTITALTPLRAVTGFSSKLAATDTLHTEGLLDILTIDFSRALTELSAILSDLKRLATLGDLPISYQGSPSRLRVHFAGCDAATVEALAVELALRRGVVGQDADFDAFAGSDIALLFPFAPSKTASESAFLDAADVRVRAVNRIPPWPADPILFSDGDGDSTRSDCGFDADAVDVVAGQPPWPDGSPSGFETVHSSELGSSARVLEAQSRATPLEYQGFEGIYRFMEMCDASARK